jgi:hypothetical protein
MMHYHKSKGKEHIQGAHRYARSIYLNEQNSSDPSPFAEDYWQMEAFEVKQP